MRHPAILLDDTRGIAMPWVAHRALRFGSKGRVGYSLAHLERSATRLHVERDTVELIQRGRTAPTKLVWGTPFTVESRTYRVETRDDVVVGARRIGEHVVCNVCFVAADRQVWRGYHVLDPTRTLGEVTVTGDQIAHTESTHGVPLGVIGNVTVQQGAHMEDAVAAALVRPLLDAPTLEMSDIMVTWDGAAVSLVDPSAVNLTNGAPGEAAVRTFHRLVNRAAPDRITKRAVSAVRAVGCAGADDVASIVRALFAPEWALEQSVREQAAMIDIAALAR